MSKGERSVKSYLLSGFVVLLALISYIDKIANKEINSIAAWSGVLIGIIIMIFVFKGNIIARGLYIGIIIYSLIDQNIFENIKQIFEIQSSFNFVLIWPLLLLILQLFVSFWLFIESLSTLGVGYKKPKAADVFYNNDKYDR